MVSTQSAQVAPALGGTADAGRARWAPRTPRAACSAGCWGSGLDRRHRHEEVQPSPPQDGKSYWLKNHIDSSAVPTDVLQDLGLDEQLIDLASAGDAGGTAADDGVRREYLVVWAGDNNVLDQSGAELTTLPKTIGSDLIGTKDLIGPDFFAVVDATEGSDTYGQVVNTATVGPLVENEPHHMQYLWHKGHNIFAGGLFTDVTYVVDTSKLPS